MSPRLLPLASLVLFALLARPAVAQTALIEEGDTVAGIGNVTSISNLTVNDDGDWVLEIDTDNVDTELDGALIDNGGVLLREGDSLPAPIGATLDSFDSVNLNASGESAWNFFLDGTTGGSDDSGIYFGTELLIQESDVSTALGFTPGTPYIGFFETKINDSNAVLVLASVDDPGIATTVDRALVLLTLDGSGNLVSEDVIVKEGDLLTGQTEVLADLETGPHAFAFNDLGDALFVADLAGATATDHAVYLGDRLLAQEGSASPAGGRLWLSLSGAEVDLNDACGWVLSGSLAGDAATNLLIEKSGAMFRQEGDTLPAISPFVLESFGTGPVLLSNSDEVLWYGEWSNPDADVDTGLFVDGELLVQEGVTTIGGFVVDTLRGIQDGYAISPNGRYVVFEAILANGTEGAYLIDRGQVAHQELRNGSGLNSLCLKASTVPAIGTTWTVVTDASDHPGASLVQFFAYPAPDDGQFIPAGELLVDLASGRLLRQTQASSGGFDTFSFPVPADVGLVGLTVYTQAVILGGGFAELCNALDATAGN